MPSNLRLPKQRLKPGVDLPPRPLDARGERVKLRWDGAFFFCPACLRTTWAIAELRGSRCQFCGEVTGDRRGRLALAALWVYFFGGLILAPIILPREVESGLGQLLGLAVATTVSLGLHFLLPRLCPPVLGLVMGGVRLDRFRPRWYFGAWAVPTFMLTMAITMRLIES